MVNGEIIRCMDKVHSIGLMGESIKEIIAMTRNMGKVFTLGLMGGCIKGDLAMENNMEKEFISNQMVNKYSAYG